MVGPAVALGVQNDRILISKLRDEVRRPWFAATRRDHDIGCINPAGKRHRAALSRLCVERCLVAQFTGPAVVRLLGPLL